MQGKNFVRLIAAALISSSLFMCGCSLVSTDSEPDTTNDLPVITVTLPPKTTSAPTRTPAPTVGTAIEPNSDYSYLDGVAKPGDVLPTLTYSEAKEQNSDVIGWLTVPGTDVDYPVVRTTDNEYYLNHNILGEESKHGAVFMDFRNADADQQKHIIIYGHNMKNGTMFHSLLNFKQKSFFTENRIISFNWNGTDTMWEIYLAAVIPLVDGHMINYVETRFEDNDEFASYMTDMIAYARTAQSSVVSDSAAVSGTDQVLTLTTCTYEADGSRFVVQARRVR